MVPRDAGGWGARPPLPFPPASPAAGAGSEARVQQRGRRPGLWGLRLGHGRPALGTGGDSAHGSAPGSPHSEAVSSPPLPPAPRLSLRAGSSSFPACGGAQAGGAARRPAVPQSRAPDAAWSGREARGPRAASPPRAQGPTSREAARKLSPPASHGAVRDSRGAGGRQVSGAQAAVGRGHRELRTGGRGASSAPCVHFGDDFAAAVAAVPSPPPPPAVSSRIPAASLRRLQPRRGQSRRVLRPRGKLLRFRGGFLRAQRFFVSGRTWKGSRPASPRRAPTQRLPGGRDPWESPESVCPSLPPHRVV